MDLRTTLRELDELILRTQSVVERETALMMVLPRSRPRFEKQLSSMLPMLASTAGFNYGYSRHGVAEDRLAAFAARNPLLPELKVS